MTIILAVLSFVLTRLEWFTLGYFLLINSFYAVLLASALVEMRHNMIRARGENRLRMLGSAVTPGISMLVPAYNEGATIGDSVRGILALHYPNLEVVVINDGSPDQTMAVLKDEFDLTPIHTIYWRRITTKTVRALYRSQRYPNLIVVDKENGGKADALNAGLNLATGQLVCAIDADTLIEPDALLRIVRPFLTRDDVLAAGGTIRVVNGCVVQGGRVVMPRVPRRPIAGFQVIEYLRAYLFGRLGWNRLGGNLVICGAFGLFQREAVVAAGGYLRDTVGEDMELVLRLRRHGYEQGGPHHVEFIPDPVAWTEAPNTLSVLGRQRDRWHRGLADVLVRHRRLLFNPRYGGMGLIAVPYFLFVELLAPVIEVVGVVGLVIGLSMRAINLPFALILFLAAYGYGLVLTSITLLLEEFIFHKYQRLRDRFLLLGWMLAESLGYRQLTVIFRLRGLIKYLRKRTDWGTMERRGFQPIVRTAESVVLDLQTALEEKAQSEPISGPRSRAG